MSHINIIKKTAFGLKELVCRTSGFDLFMRVEASVRQTRGEKHQLFLSRVTRHSLALASRLYEQVRYREHGQFCAVSLNSAI